MKKLLRILTLAILVFTSVEESWGTVYPIDFEKGDTELAVDDVQLAFSENGEDSFSGSVIIDESKIPDLTITTKTYKWEDQDCVGYCYACKENGKLKISGSSAVYNTTPISGRIKKITIKKEGTKNSQWTVYGSNNSFSNYVDGTQIESTKSIDTDGTTWEVPDSINYQFFNLMCKNPTLISSIEIEYEKIPATFSAANNQEMKAYDNDIYWATFSNSDVTFFPAGDETKTYETSARIIKNTDDGLMFQSLALANDVVIQGTSYSGYFVPANTGIILRVAFSEEDKTIPYYVVTYKEVAPLEGNRLFPGLGELTTGDGDCTFYKLAYDDYQNKTGLGFYYGADNGSAFTSKAGGAYLALKTENASSMARGIRFDEIEEETEDPDNEDPEETSIRNVRGNKNGCQVYDLSGNPIKHIAKEGLYVVSGVVKWVKVQ